MPKGSWKKHILLMEKQKRREGQKPKDSLLTWCKEIWDAADQRKARQA